MITDEQTHELVTELLSEMLDFAVKHSCSNDINGSCKIDSFLRPSQAGCNDDVVEVVNKMIDTVVSQEAVDNLKSVGNSIKPIVRNAADIKSSSVLGISQTGRIMDPICLQRNIFTSIKAENLVEYQWPPGTSGDYYMLQEQVSTFLNITSFKRKYPTIERRKLDPAEVNHLLSNHVISEVQVTLGLTALRSADVCDLMVKEYPDKYIEYNNVMQEREKQKMRNKYKQFASSATTHADKSQMNMKRAISQAAAYNAHINRQRREEFAVYYDLSTNVLQYPRNKVRKVDPSLTRPSLYPCALIPGQFQEYYHKYTRDELMYLPLNTTIFGPPQPPPLIADGELSGSESESAVESDASASSLPRSVKSVSSNKTKSKTSKQEQSRMQTSEPVERIADQVDNPDNNLKLEAKIENQDHDEPDCGICHKDESSNKKGEPEKLIKCSQCDNHGHPSCLEMSDELVTVIQTYNWQCMECKTCTICSLPHREDRMMFCDRCDRGYHTFCVSLRAIPSGVWACSRCTFADPEFVKRKRKQLRASLSPGVVGRGRGRRRRQPRQVGAREISTIPTTDEPQSETTVTPDKDENSMDVSHPSPDSPTLQTESDPLVEQKDNELPIPIAFIKSSPAIDGEQVEAN